MKDDVLARRKKNVENSNIVTKGSFANTELVKYNQSFS
jgi:hypothetical protein